MFRFCCIIGQMFSYRLICVIAFVASLKQCLRVSNVLFYLHILVIGCLCIMLGIPDSIDILALKESDSVLKKILFVAESYLL